MNRVSRNYNNFLVEINKWLKANFSPYQLKVVEIQINDLKLVKVYYNKEEDFEPGITKRYDEMSEYIDGLYRGFQMFTSN